MADETQSLQECKRLERMIQDLVEQVRQFAASSAAEIVEIKQSLSMELAGQVIIEDRKGFIDEEVEDDINDKDEFHWTVESDASTYQVSPNVVLIGTDEGNDEGAASGSSSMAESEVTKMREAGLFCRSSFKIYRGVAGLYDYGPPGCVVKSNVLTFYRQHFLPDGNMLEVNKFTDHMVKDMETGMCYQADPLLKDICNVKQVLKILQGISRKENLIQALVVVEWVYGVKVRVKWKAQQLIHQLMDILEESKALNRKIGRRNEILSLPMQNASQLDFSAAEQVWSKVEGWRDKIERVALIPFARVDDFVSVGMWVESHQSSVSYKEFSDTSLFILGIKKEWQLQQLIHHGNHNLLALNSRFGTHWLKCPIQRRLAATCSKHDTNRWLKALNNRVRIRDPSWKLAGFIVDDASGNFLSSRDVLQCSLLLGFWRVCHAWHKNLVKRCPEVEMCSERSRWLGNAVDNIRGRNTTDKLFEGFMHDLVEARDLMDYFKAVWILGRRAWTIALKNFSLAIQETSATMEFYQTQLKVHAYFWLNEYFEKGNFARDQKNEWASSWAAWRGGLKIPEFVKFDTCAREDIKKIDCGMKLEVERLRHIV